MYSKLTKNAVWFCDHFGIVIRIGVWIYLIGTVALAVLGLWLLAQPEEVFVLSLADTGGGLAGYGCASTGLSVVGDSFLEHFATVEFLRGTLNESALDSEKTAYLLGYLDMLVRRASLLLVLWPAARVFRSIDREETPFTERNVKSLLAGGVAMWVSRWLWDLLYLGLLRTYWIYGGEIHGGSNYELLSGITLICLSFVFQYGLSLQRESDETL